jgi:putative oxidoreductase
MRSLLKTRDDVVPLILRVFLAIVMFPHGAQKVLGWFGGYGLAGTMHFMTGMGIPAVFAALAIAAEFLGPIGLFIGLLTRVAAFAIGVEMVVAAMLVHTANGFFMNWTGQQKGEGFEYHLLVIAVSVALMITGGGKLSLDLALSSRAPQTK